MKTRKTGCYINKETPVQGYRDMLNKAMLQPPLDWGISNENFWTFPSPAFGWAHRYSSGPDQFAIP